MLWQNFQILCFPRHFWPFITCHYLLVDGVVGLHGVEGVGLGTFDDFLRVVEEEHTEQNQTAVQTDRVEPGAQGSGRWEEGRACNIYCDVLKTDRPSTDPNSD